MILDKLLEKKDIYAYINFRIRELRLEMARQMKSIDKKRREFIRQRAMGRIEELKRLDKALRENIRKQSIIIATNVLKKERGRGGNGRKT